MFVFKVFSRCNFQAQRHSTDNVWQRLGSLRTIGVNKLLDPHEIAWLTTTLFGVKTPQHIKWHATLLVGFGILTS